MKLNRFLIIGLTIFIAGAASYAQGDTIMKFSLSQAQDYAIENFYISKNSKLEIEKAKKVVLETTSIGLPQVKASGSWAYIPGTIPTLDFGSSIGGSFGPVFSDLISKGYLNPDSLPQSGEPVPIAERSTITYGFTVSQLIFSGEYIVGLQASRTYKSLSEQINSKTNLEIKQSTAESYFAILILEKNKEILEKTLVNLEQSYNQMSKLGKAGFVDETDVDQLNITLTRTKNSMVALERQIEVMYKLFKYQLGAPENANLTLTDDISNLITSHLVNDSSYIFNIEDNIDYQLLDTQEKLMKLSLKRQQSTYLPTIAGFYQYQDKTKKPVLDFTMKHIVGVSVEVPIFTSGGRYARICQAKIDLEEAKNKKDQESERLNMQAEQAIYDYNSAYDNFVNEESNFELSEKVYERSTEKFKQGLISSLDLTMINNQYLQAQMTYSTSIQKLLSAKVNMDKTFSKL